ncbi:MAG: hypothetical protein GKS01_05020 [Alphaproteobacteria bacterium]|nr:hypothetical protein [Alphaproteobacteria bacterium]
MFPIVDQHQYKIKVEYWVSLVVFLIGVFFFFLAMTIETSKEAIGPRTMPLMLAVSLIISGVWLALRAFLDRAGDLRDGYGFLDSNIKRIVEVIGCGVLLIFMFWGFGYFVALITAFVVTLYAFGNRNWVGMIACAIIMAIIFQWVFMGVMLLSDPKGFFVDLRPYTDWMKG